MILLSLDDLVQHVSSRMLEANRTNEIKMAMTK